MAGKDLRLRTGRKESSVMADDLAKLKRRVRYLERKLIEAEAERDLCEMMAHDLASEPLIRTIESKYPALTMKWRAA